MIQCMISDIDGTLLHGAQIELDPAVFVQIQRLRSQGILFCPASGRQYQSLRRLFAPIADEICYICENGSIVYGAGNPGQVLSKVVLPTKETQQLCAEILALEGVELVISGENTSYICPKEQDLTNRLETYLGNNVKVVASPADVPEDIIKVNLFARDGITPAMQALQVRWCKTFDAVVSGRQWMDFTQSDKSMGVQTICAHLGIAPEHIVAVGDNYNDVGMLNLVGHPYLMENAATELKASISTYCNDVVALMAQIASEKIH